ncbi:hypothetical protein D3C86_1165440 [compost metagenome]
MPGQAQGHSSILGHAFFRNVQARHDLDPRHQQRRQFALGPEHFTQLTIHPHAHRQVLLEGFQVHIRGMLTHRFTEQRVDQANDRRVALLLQQVGGLRDLIDQAEQVQFFVQSLGNLLHRTVPLAIGRRQARGVLIGPDDLKRQCPPAHPARLRQCGERRVATQGKAQVVAVMLQQHAKTPGEAEGQLLAEFAHGFTAPCCANRTLAHRWPVRTTRAPRMAATTSCFPPPLICSSHAARCNAAG